MDRTPEGTFEEIKRFKQFLNEKLKENVLSLEDVGAVYHEFNVVMQQANVMPYSWDEVSAATARHGLHLMKTKLIELHPEFADQVRNLGGGQSR